MENVKILLTSDLHLGMERMNPLISRDERFQTFLKIMSLASEHDILLLAGDILNAGGLDSRYIDSINNELMKASDAGTEIYFTPGSGEIEPEGRLHEQISELNTTYTFYENRKEMMIKSDKGELFIYGQQNGNSPFSPDIRRKEKQGFHIGLFYADFSPQSTEKNSQGCIGKKEIKNMDLDFFAMGKSHNFRLFRFSERLLGAYPGSPEPCTIDECGDRFVISMEIENNRVSFLKRLPVNTVSIRSHEIECTEIKDEKELIERIKNAGSRDTMNRLELHGERDFAIGPALSEKLTGYFRGLKIVDMTEPSQKTFLEEGAAGDSFRASFFRNLEARIKNDPANSPDYNFIKDIISGKNGKTGGVLFCDS